MARSRCSPRGASCAGFASWPGGPRGSRSPARARTQSRRSIAATEPDRAGELADEEVAFDLRLRRARRRPPSSAPPRGPPRSRRAAGGRPAWLADRASRRRLRASRAAVRVSQPLSAATRSSTWNSRPGSARSRREVVHALEVPQANRVPLERDRPVVALATEGVAGRGGASSCLIAALRAGGPPAIAPICSKAEPRGSNSAAAGPPSARWASPRPMRASAVS